MPRAPETEALDEGSAQKGFGVSSIDGSPFPLGSTATHETTGLKTPGSRGKTAPNKLIPAITNNHRGTSGSRVAHQNNKKVPKATPG
jgi:hypothetical protein